MQPLAGKAESLHELETWLLPCSSLNYSVASDGCEQTIFGKIPCSVQGFKSALSCM